MFKTQTRIDLMISEKLPASPTATATSMLALACCPRFGASECALAPPMLKSLAPTCPKQAQRGSRPSHQCGSTSCELQALFSGKGGNEEDFTTDVPRCRGSKMAVRHGIVGLRTSLATATAFGASASTLAILVPRFRPLPHTSTWRDRGRLRHREARTFIGFGTVSLLRRPDFRDYGGHVAFH